MARTKRPTTSTTSKSTKDSSIKKRARATTKQASKLKPKAKTNSNAKSLPKMKGPKRYTHDTLFFHDPADPISGFLSPWYKSILTIDSIKYQSAGHYIMAEKARLFKDKKTLDKILASKSADEHKALDALTIANRANDEKFLHASNSSRLRKKLLPFAEHELVYASPTDHHFGIGKTEEEAGDPDLMRDRKNWGENIFGHSLHSAKHETYGLAHPESRIEDEETMMARIRSIDACVHW
ncbi:hypothetical protein GRF29_1g3556628 [Pseudopithomyces chartarum]|uniref:NADAR domain-containing protein n=1 Tax=Pseudopithomyces chartarum TaxID=1892770 RepID=A0AAN6M993_9PLEO|nr:hypothetical protein GRF29_1g3556628 [Pseudopithomyces chartarum]